MEKEQSLIDEFNKSSVELVKVHLSKWRNQGYIDVRILITSDLPGEDSELPTKKRIRINVVPLPRLIQALEKAQEILDERARKRSKRLSERRSREG